MKELELKYGCNPNQKPSRIYMNDDRELPIKLLSGRPGYINFLDAFRLQLHSSMYHQPEQLLVFHCQRHWRRFTG